VVYKDSDIANANRKAEAINEIWPELHATVFPLADESYFGVATGGAVERAAAGKLIKRMKVRGFPHAAWVKTVSPNADASASN
jgi:hypothetical protein